MRANDNAVLTIFENDPKAWLSAEQVASKLHLPLERVDASLRILESLGRLESAPYVWGDQEFTGYYLPKRKPRCGADKDDDAKPGLLAHHARVLVGKWLRAHPHTPISADDLAGELQQPEELVADALRVIHSLPSAGGEYVGDGECRLKCFYEFAPGAQQSTAIASVPPPMPDKAGVSANNPVSASAELYRRDLSGADSAAGRASTSQSAPATRGREEEFTENDDLDLMYSKRGDVFISKGDEVFRLDANEVAELGSFLEKVGTI